MKKLLITGGAGFIGSHTCLDLLAQGFRLIVLDNFSNSSPIALERVKQLAANNFGKKDLSVVNGSILDSLLLNKLFEDSLRDKDPIAAVVHFAGLKSVNESTLNPLKYWEVNVGGTLSVIKAMNKYDCNHIVFSSTSTVYGEPINFPITEKAKTNPLHTYAKSKLVVENMLRDLSEKNNWRVACLRYFNPVGAHPSGLIGEDPCNIPGNLFPFITQIAAGRRTVLKVFGNTYPTPDGTGIRDYLHVMDLAEAHSATLNFLLNTKSPINLTLNLGTGKGLSVLDIIKGFESATGISIPYEIVSRRPGDVAKLEACPALAEKLLGWRAKRSLEDMCRDGWAWQSTNPLGYRVQT